MVTTREAPAGVVLRPAAYGRGAHPPDSIRGSLDRDGGRPMTIRGGGAPSGSMALRPLWRMDPPLRNFAADAHGCIMVPIRMDRPNTSLWRDDWRPVASSPQVVVHRTAARLL